MTNVKAKMKIVVEESNTYAGKVFDLSIQVLILVSLIAFSVETLPELDPEYRGWLDLTEKISVAIFTIEYLLRVFVADKKNDFILSFFGAVDFIAIAPFYLALGLDLRSIRAFRFLRLFRVLKMARYSKAVQRFHRAFLHAREELTLFFMVGLMALYFSAVGIYFFEKAAQPEAFSSVIHSLWWAVVTLTTVGYGDVYPMTVGGRIFAFFVIMIGVGFVSVPSGIMATALSEARKAEKNTEAEK
ncbi:MAG: ion transporter [Myxococcota bacterium]|nr:ion transporter [Myxococcota bacterium]